MLWYLFRAPVYLYRWGLGWLFGKRLLLLTHTGRRTGLQRQTLLEVVEYRKEGPEVVVANGFGPECDWVRNIEARPGEEVTVGSQHFVAVHRHLSEDEAVKVIQGYERRNRLIARSFVRVSAGFSAGSIIAAKMIAGGWLGNSLYWRFGPVYLLLSASLDGYFTSKPPNCSAKSR